MKDLCLEAKGASIVVRGNLDKDKELAIGTKFGKIFLNIKQIEQLRDHLTQILDNQELV